METSKQQFIHALENATHLNLHQLISVDEARFDEPRKIYFSFSMELRYHMERFLIDEVCELIETARNCDRKQNFKELMDWGGFQEIKLAVDKDDDPFDRVDLSGNCYNIALVEMMTNGHRRLKPLRLSLNYNGYQQITDELMEYVKSI
jgi:hypothetical protein